MKAIDLIKRNFSGIFEDAILCTLVLVLCPASELLSEPLFKRFTKQGWVPSLWIRCGAKFCFALGLGVLSSIAFHQFLKPFFFGSAIFWVNDVMDMLVRLPGRSTQSRMNGTTPTHRIHQMRILRLLAAFAWFCSQENRENIELIANDLKKDVKAMRRSNYSELFVQCVLFWQVLAKTILPILWDAICRTLAAILPIRKLFSKITDF